MMYEVTVVPDNFLMAITKIGGLLGFLKIFTVVRALHERQFDKMLEKEHKRENE